LTIRPTVATDLQHLNVETFGNTARGLTVEKDGKPIGVAGVLHSSPFQAFSVMDDELRKHPKIIVKFIRGFEDFLSRHYTRVVAIASSGENKAPACLVRAGFNFFGFDKDGEEVYQWQQQYHT
jgi:hypothetical protein